MPLTTSPWDTEGVTSAIEGFWDSPNEMALRRAVADWIGPGSSTLLDVGCGTARMATLLRRWRYTGIDGSREMLRVAGRRTRKRLIHHDLSEPLPFKDDEFHTVLCQNVLRHLDSYGTVLAEIARVARRQVYIVESFQKGGEHLYATTEVAGQAFPDNAWSLPLFLADVAHLFPGWRAETDDLPGLAWSVLAVRMEAP